MLIFSFLRSNLLLTKCKINNLTDQKWDFCHNNVINN